MNQHAHASAAVLFGYLGNSWDYDETTKTSATSPSNFSKGSQAVMGKPLHAFGAISVAQAKNVWTVSSPLLSDILNELV